MPVKNENQVFNQYPKTIMIPQIIHYTWFSNDPMPAEIIDCINTIDIEPKAIKALLKTENVLDDFYDEWLNIDGNLYETFEYAIEIKIKQLSDEFYNKDDKDVEQENKSVKTQNKARDCR